MLDRCIPQAWLQGLPPEGATTFSDGREGCRPGRSARQASARAQRDLGEGYSWVVALEQCLERGNHDTLRSLVNARVADRRGWPRLDRDLTAGALTGEGLAATVEGTPPGGPGSPVLTHLRLAGLARAGERRGHRCGRDADDGTIDVKSARAGPRVVASVTRVWARRLKLAVKAAKSGGDRPGRRTLLGLTCTGQRPNRRRVHVKALKACKPAGRRQTSRTRGVSRARVVGGLRRPLEGWYTYVSVAEAPSVFKALDAWRRRRLRGYLWQPWGRRRSRALRRRGVRRDLAWNTVKSAPGPWRLRRRPALAIALPGRDGDGRGLPRRSRGSHR